MPELPEVETTRRGLLSGLLGRRVVRVDVHRRDVVRGDSSCPALLEGDRFEALERRGKQLALVARRGRCVSVHLGMSGRLELVAENTAPSAHTHVIWELDGGGQLRFVDPRRFGGLWTHPERGHLARTRWDALGPDALSITPEELQAACCGRRTAVKCVLLDQKAVAGVGNIYADEALYAAGIRPQRSACDLSDSDHRVLARSVRRVLSDAIRAKGSTIKDYRTADGQSGNYARSHAVYGRGGESCLGCGRSLLISKTAGRTTVHCARCQS